MRKQVYICDVCNIERKTVNHWFIVSFVNGELRLSCWNEEKAKKKDVMHVCGTAHAHTLVDQYTASMSGKEQAGSICQDEAVKVG